MTKQEIPRVYLTLLVSSRPYPRLILEKMDVQMMMMMTTIIIQNLAIIINVAMLYITILLHG